jgi:hypothetical protein
MFAAPSAGSPPEAVLHCDAAIHNGRPLPAPVRVLVLGATVAWDELVAAAGPQWDAPVGAGLVEVDAGRSKACSTGPTRRVGCQDAIGSDLWLRLAESSERDRPADALAVYQRIADEVLERADRRAYHSASRILQRARGAAQAAGELGAFAEYLTRLRERYRRRPTLIAILDKAGLR